MPAPTHVIVICPIPKLADCLSILGIDVSNGPNLYTEADAPVRSATHQVRSGPVNSTQMAAVQAHIASPDPDLEGVICCLWLRSEPSPYDDLLTTHGLTTQDGSI